MAYAAISFTFGEQPSAAKWNILGTNDASFNDGTGIANDAITATKIDWASTGADGGIWWEELGRSTASGNVTSLSVTGIGARKYLKVLCAIITNGSSGKRLVFNNDTGANYANRYSSNGGADTTETSNSSGCVAGTTSTSTNIVESIIINVAAKEKSVYTHIVENSTAGAGTAPGRIEVGSKWVNTSDQISRIDLVGSASALASGTEIVVLGHD